MSEDAKLVLIVDDDADTRYVYSRLLAHRGYEVLEAEDARTGIALAQAAAPAMIIMDYMLPGMSGWEAIRLLKGDLLTAHIPILNVTAYSYGEVADDAYRAGCNEFVEKPCDPFVIVDAVERWIGAAAPARTAPVRGAPRLDTSDGAIGAR
jgi:two-component system, cell cycle response regulator DivK